MHRCTLKPYGTINADKNFQHFNPALPVKPCYFGVDRKGLVLGFTQHHKLNDENIFCGIIFSPMIGVIAWDGKGDVAFDAKTYQRFSKIFQQATGVEPIMDK